MKGREYLNFIGIKVKHKAFGEGKVIDYSSNYLVISFAQGDKKFIYPDAFKTFITAVDPEVDALIKKEIADAEDAKVTATKAEKQRESTAEAASIEVAKRTVTVYKTRSAKSACAIEKGPRGRQYFFVFQNKSFDAEQRGGYLWAPKSNLDGRRVSHWKLMEEVREGDVIFHSVNKNIAAISIATSNCYSAMQPPELQQEQMWEDDGWRVDSKYITIQNSIITSDYMDTIMELQPTQYAPFNVLGRGNTGYLFASNHALSQFLFDRMRIRNTYLNEIAEEIGLEKK